jgi:hypothetical protein
MTYAHPIDRYSYTARRASPSETELSRTADRFAWDHGYPVTLRVREIGGVMFLQHVVESFDTDTREVTTEITRCTSLGCGKEAARINLMIELWNLVTMLDTIDEIDPDPVPFAPSIVSRVSGWFTRAAIAVLPAVTAVGFLVSALH